MRDAYRERIVQLDDPEKIHEAMLDSVLDASDADATALYDFICIWNNIFYFFLYINNI